MTQPMPRGKPFQPGQSGNPGGRPKGVEEVRALAQKLTARVFEELERIAFTSPDDRARLAAIHVILDRAWGRPSQALEGDGVGGPVQIQIVRYSDLPTPWQPEAA